ncbi:heat shock protein 90 [Salpingoeca rosetta]|uniref:Heat shock protein 90 n=1 Tax=Salpingoeca rosetta (strain ATCC 50818 / BSB-021) TaxID=946362 RepID=F2UN36_SALR5|nr:heat shock protein 90 [Salpingoeca rosetta]EGD78535.1 heat shock protein 90 [Salpingoeca rosetta]|eukprot:XP_004989484.1 heat shock protein 90 [Salpingoeca rosetta]
MMNVTRVLLSAGRRVGYTRAAVAGCRAVSRCMSTDGTGASAASVEVDTAHTKSHSFQAETTKLLDIVAKSLYSEREVFVRELISNAADALEKLRYLQTTGESIEQPDEPLQISITTDEEAGTFSIEDTGIGMSEEELVENLGTIARSGSKAFIEKLGETATGNAQARDNIIGQFGVGFYAGFMVGTDITVYSKSYMPEVHGNMWHSTGHGSYDIAPAKHVRRGTKIVIKLRDDATEFAKGDRVQEIITKYSNFVGFPITVNGSRINTVEPLWTLNPSDITQEQHESFYKFVSNSFDKPMYTIQYSTDAPLMIRSLLYVPTMQLEKYGMGRMDPGVSLYCRKVLIKSKMENLFPSWLRFLRGVVDSEDIPLNLSREMLQDTALIRRIGDILTGRVIKHLERQKTADRAAYTTFATEYASFLREGVCTDDRNKAAIAKLLLLQSSTQDESEMTTIPEYIERQSSATDGDETKKQEAEKDPVYYVLAPNRAAALASPYMETMLANNKEVLIMNHPLDVFVVEHLMELDGHKLVSIESSKVSNESDEKTALSEDEVVGLKAFFESALSKDKLAELKISTRLTSSPAIVVDHESAGRRRLMRMMSQEQDDGTLPLPPQTLEINPTHPIIQGINAARLGSDDDKARGRVVAAQVFDNALIAAGLMEEPRSMMDRLNELCVLALNRSPDSTATTTTK